MGQCISKKPSNTKKQPSIRETDPANSGPNFANNPEKSLKIDCNLCASIELIFDEPNSNQPLPQRPVDDIKNSSSTTFVETSTKDIIKQLRKQKKNNYNAAEVQQEIEKAKQAVALSLGIAEI
jgi:hypothetical protein